MKKLKISLYSFGFAFSGIPKDSSGNGGGFVFDCRFLPNPYYDPTLKEHNGLTLELHNFFLNIEICQLFIENTFDIIKASANEYLKKGYKDLYVAYGCTGGFHRSVYCSNQVYKRLQNEGFDVVIKHVEI